MFLVFVLLLGGCSVGTDTRRSTSEKENKTENSFKGSLGGETIRVLSGSENQGLSDILKECAGKTGVTIEMIYKGSVDIMHELEEGQRVMMQSGRPPAFGFPWEINIIITFDSRVKNIYVSESAEDAELEQLYYNFSVEEPDGGTDMYLALEEGLRMISESYDLWQYTPALILMSDGESVDSHKQDFWKLCQQKNLDVPVFSIMFGNAQSAQLEDLAELTNARVFDGRKDLVAAFRSVKGYN